MSPYYIIYFCLTLFHIPVGGWEIVEHDNIFRVSLCPAFIVYDSVAYLSDMDLELPCPCKPEHIYSVVWFYRKNTDTEYSKVLTDLNGTVLVNPKKMTKSDILFRFSIIIFSLIIYKAQVEDSGHFICGTEDGEYFYGYEVDVQESKHATVTFEDKDMHPRADYMYQYFTVFTVFWEWTKCDRCDVRGEQRRLGLCYVKSKYLHPRYRLEKNLDVAPCGSPAVPLRFRKLISRHAPEIVIRSCTTDCMKKGNGFFNMIKQTLLDKIESLKHKLPWIPKVYTQFHSHELGTPLIIKCPDSKPESAVAWDKGEERMYRTEWLFGTNKTMRVFIDHGNHLNFRYVKQRDKGIYYCWLEGKLKAGFRLSVTRNPNLLRKFSDPDSIFAMKVIGLSFLFFTIFFVVIHCFKFFCYNLFCCPCRK